MEILIFALVFALWISLVYVSSLLFEAMEKKLEKAKQNIFENLKIRASRKEQVR